MYPQVELTRLAAHKAALLERIGRRRAQSAAAAAQVARPLAWLDRMLGLWRQLSPLAKFAAVPLGFLAGRKIFPRLKILGALVRWGPLVFSTIRGVYAAEKHRGRP